MRSSLVTAALVLLGAAPAFAQTFPGADWQPATPESQGLDSARLQAAMNHYGSSIGGPGVTQAVVIRNGYLVWRGSDIDNLHHTWSCTKSFTSTALGLLIDSGRCSLDTLAKDHVPALAPLYSGVKLRHFTTMTSGYSATGNDGGHGQSPTWWQPTTPRFAPGAKYEYWDSAMNQFSQTMTVIAGESLEALFRRRIADPIGMTSWDWVGNGSVGGIEISGGAGNSGGMSVTARQFARFGHLFLNRGRWNGAQLISSSWVDQATRCQVPTSVPANDPSGIYGPGLYGFNWWTNGVQPNGQRLYPAAPVGTFFAWGLNENRCWVIPEWNMVIVRLGLSGNHNDSAYNTFFQMVADAMGAAPPPPAAPTVTGFTLVNADSDADLGPLSNGATLNLATLPTRNLNVRANTNPPTTGSVRFGLDGNAGYRVESAAPYALAGDSGGNYNPWTPAVGSHALSGTAFSGPGATGTAGATATISFTVVDNPTAPSLAVTSLTLINADTDQPIGALDSGALLHLASLPTRKLNVRANTTPVTVGSVRFGFDGNGAWSVENAAPYAFGGDSSGDYNPWTPAVGNHSMSATAFSNSGATGTASAPLTITFTVTDSPPVKAEALAGTPIGGNGSGGACGLLGLEGMLLLVALRRRRWERRAP
jgi:CubicO group peptidase (beta-lactamase class C family)